MVLLRVAAAKRYPFKIAPTLAQHADIGHMVKLVEYFVKEEFDRVFCLLDMDMGNERNFHNAIYG